MAKNEAKIRFSAETKEFNDSIKKSNDTMSELRAEMKLNDTQMKATGATVEGLENKHKILSNQLSASESKTEALSQKVAKAAEIFGENSQEATKLRTQLLNAQTAQEKLRQAVAQCADELEAQKKAENQTETATERLTSTINEQQAELNQLKAEYKEAVLQYGKTSDEAQNLAKRIDKLSDDLTENKKKMSDAEYAAEDLDKSLDEVGDSARDASEGFTVMKGAMADLVADGIEKVASGLGEITTEAFTMANDIDKATNTFIAKTGESAESAEDFEAVMTDIYNGNYGESFEDIADSMAIVKTTLSDLSDDELKKVTTDALILRDTFDMDVNESVRAANSLMNQYGISADEAFNLIAQGAQNGLNQNGDLLDVINEYAVQFKTAGYSADDMFNMLANGAETGTWSVDKLGDAVKEFNIRASDGTVGDSIKENAKAFGMTTTEASKLAKEVESGSVEAYQKLREKLLEVDDDTKRYQLGVEMFGTMWEDLGEETVMSLLNTQGEINRTKNSLKEIDSVKYNDLGSAIEGIKRNLQTAVAEPMKNEVMPAVNEFIEDVDWQGVGQVIGEVFGAVAEGAVAIANGIKEATQWMREHQGVVVAIASVIGVLTTAITAYNIVQGIKNAMDAANVTTVWGLVSAHIAQAAAAMAAIAPYVLIVAAIAAVIAIIVLCVKHWDEIVAAVKKAWEAIKATLAKWGEWINTNVVQPVKDFFVGLWDDITSACGTAWEWVKGVFSSFVSWISTNIVQPIVNFFTGLWTSLQNIWNQICNVVRVAIMFIGSLISAAVQIIAIPFKFIWENCKEYVFAAWEWIKNAVKTAFDFVKKIITTVGNGIKNTFKTIWNGIKTIVGTVWDWIKKKVTTVINAVKSVITKVWNAVKSVTTTVFNAIKSVVTSVWNNIKAKITTAINAVKSVVSSVWNAIKSVTSSIWNGIKNTVSNIWNSIKSAISSAINAIKSIVTSVWNAIKSVVSNVMNGIKSTISGAWNTVKSTVSGAINGVKSSISSGLNAASSTVSSVLNGIKSKFSSIWDSCKSVVSGAISKIKGFLNFNWSLPKLKMPHFSISGKFSLNPPSVPRLSVDWYKDGGIFTKPTIFNTPYGMKGVGEAGAEAVLPIDRLEGYISGAIEKAQNVVNLQSLANAIEELASRPMVMNINGRQFATATASDGDSVNGLRTSFKRRGLIVE